MKKLFFMAVLAASAFSFSSCNNDDLPESKPETDGTELRIKTEVAAISAVSTRATPVSVFPEGASLGLYVTSGLLDNIYDSYTANANVKSVLGNGVWSQTPVVRLTNENATVFAYYPYSSLNKDGKEIFVDHGTQQDYMYGTHTPGQAAINKNNPAVNLTMKHAMAMVQFYFSKSNYPWKGNLTLIEIANAEGKTVIYSEGTMDISTGEITNIPGKNRAAALRTYSDIYPLLTIPEKPATDEQSFLKVFVLPVVSTGAEGDVVFNFTIDDRIYTWKVPANTIWKAGTKNTYTVTITGSALRLSEVAITDWTEGTGRYISLED